MPKTAGGRRAGSCPPTAGTTTYQRISTAPQVKPPPIASSITKSPLRMRPSFTATSSASGTDAAEVLPVYAMSRAMVSRSGVWVA